MKDETSSNEATFIVPCRSNLAPLSKGALPLFQYSLCDQITEQIHKLRRIISRHGVRYLPIRLPGHAGIDQSNNRNLQARRLVDHRALSLRIEDHHAIGRLRRADVELLVPAAEPPRARAVGQESPEAPRGVVLDSDGLGHLRDDLVEDGVGVDEEQPRVVAGEVADEVAGVADAYQALIGVDDADAVAGALGEDLEVVLRHAPADVGVRVDELLYQYGVERHFLRLEKDFFCRLISNVHIYERRA